MALMRTSQKDGGERKLTESGRSRKTGGLCLRSSVDERLSIFELGLSEEVFMLTKCVGNFLVGMKERKQKSTRVIVKGKASCAR
jgi:hypothetical protein